MGKSQQRKGRGGESELAGILRDHGYDVHVGDPQNYGTEPDLTGLPSIHIEAKRTETMKMSQWVEQAKRDSERFCDGAPAIFHRYSRKPWTVTMLLSDWLRLYKIYSEVQQKGGYDESP